MQLFSRSLERQLYNNARRHMFGEELDPRIQRLKECFPGGVLPLPSVQVTTAWNDLPNRTVDVLPISMRTELVDLRAPPPTPTTESEDDATSSDSSFSDNQDRGWVLVDNRDGPRRDGRQDLVAESDAASRYGFADRKRALDEDGIKVDRASPSLSCSDQDSLSSASHTSSTPAGFRHMVDRWYLDYRARGTDAFVGALIAFGTAASKNAQPASRIAFAILRRVAKISYTEGKGLENAVRFSALASFKKCWEKDDTWKGESPIPHGIHTASLIGSLFDAKMLTARDVHLCLSFLLDGKKRFGRLCAMHAMLVRANDKLCKNRNLPALMEFRRSITSREGEFGELRWVTTPRAQLVLTDILGMIKRWTVSQALRREQLRVPTNTKCPARRRAVGPRLRGLLY